MFFNRRTLLRASPLLLTPKTRAQDIQLDRLSKVSDHPNFATAWTEPGAVKLIRNGSRWQGSGIELMISPKGRELAIELEAPKASLLRIHLRWRLAVPAGFLYLGDHWERSYGDLAWRGLEPERVMPWYFLATNGRSTSACGVKTAPAAFCFWQADPEGVSLWLDVRNGGRGVQLGDRRLALATIVTGFFGDTKPFAAAQQFCRSMCEKPRLPREPVYGGNNWYYAYGKSSAEDIRADSERIASLAGSAANRPFMVIDDGWSPNSTAGPWRGNYKFPDMAELAAEMMRVGVQPGLWVRPLFTKEDSAPGERLKSPNAARELAKTGAFTLDPTVPAVQEKIRQDVSNCVGWGYRLIKHDFSTYDLLGRWGPAMGAQITDSGWGFADPARTSAEIICGLYQLIRNAAGDALVLGCNTVGHLSAGLFELQRTGDDTSGRDWNRTRRMGVNTLAFRAPQHGAFFALDADCVGLTREISWNENRQWLDLLAHSGTPLFVSIAPDALGNEQRTAVTQAFKLASSARTVAEPIDWLENNEPQRWSADGRSLKYDWFEDQGASPFST